MSTPTTPPLTYEALEAIAKAIKEQKLPMDGAKIISIGGYTAGDPGFKEALEAFKRDHLPVVNLQMARIEAAFNREFEGEPNGKVRR
ncbi:MAG: hypothetical protein V4641_05485 [Pseudomonadota bacterium]